MQNPMIIQANEIFIWISGIYGSGKTYQLELLKHKSEYQFNIVMESELNYTTDITKLNAIDNITIIDSKMKFLNQLWFDIINYHWKTGKPLYLTSTKTFSEWIKALNEFCPEHAGAIASRMKMNTFSIKLEDKDWRLLTKKPANKNFQETYNKDSNKHLPSIDAEIPSIEQTNKYLDRLAKQILEVQQEKLNQKSQ